MRKRLSKGILGALFLLFAGGCSVQKMAGDAILEYTHDEAVPYLMSQGDLASACQMGQALGPVVASLSRVGLEPDAVGIATQMAAGMCAEFDQREAELDRLRAVYESRPAAAQDALVREKYGHYHAAVRMARAYESAVKRYGDLSAGCVSYEDGTDGLLSLLGMASGALALLHDFNSEKVAGISLDVPMKIEKGAACFDDDTWWGMPTALRAAIWLSIPGAGPEGVDPLEAMERAAQKGDAQGVLLARAMLAMMASNVGNREVMCRAIADIPQMKAPDGRYAMLNAYAMGILTHLSDVEWTKAKGYRAPYMAPSCVADVSETLDDATVDDLLDGLLDDGAGTPDAGDGAGE